MFPINSVRAINLSCVFIVAILFIFLDSVNGHFNNGIDATLLTQKIGARHTITVDLNGQGNFGSIQDAIDHVPDGNSHWTTIHITKGIYREKVSIPRSKPYIFMKGDGRGKTSIIWPESSEKPHESATLIVEAPHFVAYGISFKNTAPTGISHTRQSNSVATLVGGDKAAFYECGFFSNHNTLFDYKGRHYYDRCYIQGSVDFIFGHGQAMFHDCELFVIPNWKSEIRGSIAAHHRLNHDESTGFVFVKGRVYGIGGDHVYLGRAKGAHSRVIFANTYLSKTVRPGGWTDWSYPGSRDNLYHAEYKSHGPGSVSANRAHWSKQLSDEEAAPFLSIDFVHGKEWLPATSMAE